MQLELEDIADVLAGLVREATSPLIAANEALAAENKVLAETNGSLAERLTVVEARELPDIAACYAEAVREVMAAGALDLQSMEAKVEALAKCNLDARLAELEAREIPEAIKGEPGRDGRDIDDIQLKQDGRDLEWAFVFGDTKTIFEVEIPEGLPGKDGRDVDMEEVGQRIETAVEAAAKALPVPKDGESGKDGPGFVAALLDGDGALVLTRTDGTVQALGKVKGEDGRDGIGFAEAFEDDGKFIVRMTDGSELTMPLPELPDFDPPAETCEYVAKALRVFAELPEAQIEPAHIPEPTKQLPIVLNVNAGGVTPAPAKTIKTITSRRDGSGNLVADIVERPDI